jgi:hypothetical protein
MIRPRVVLRSEHISAIPPLFCEGLADGGKIITLDVEEETNKVARSFAAKTPYADRIDFRLGNAIDIIPTLPETFDLVFIDADKPKLLKLLQSRFRQGPSKRFHHRRQCPQERSAFLKRKKTRTHRHFTISIKWSWPITVENVLLPIRDGFDGGMQGKRGDSCSKNGCVAPQLNTERFFEMNGRFEALPQVSPVISSCGKLKICLQ